MRVPQVNESAHLNSVGNLIPPTDRPTNHPCTLGRPSRAGVRVGWMIQPTRTPARDGRPRVRGCWIEKRTEVQSGEG